MTFSATLTGIFFAAVFYCPFKSNTEKFIIASILLTCIVLECFLDGKFPRENKFFPHFKAVFLYITFVFLYLSFFEKVSFDDSNVYEIFIFGAVPSLFFMYLPLRYGSRDDPEKGDGDDDDDDDTTTTTP